MKNPTRANIVEFYDKFLEYIKTDHERPNARHTYVCKKHLAALLTKPGTKVLDLGCGTGITSLFMAKQDAEVTAIDISPKLIRFAKKNSAHENIHYLMADITEFEIGINEKYDLITLVDIFEHLPVCNTGLLLNKIYSLSHEESVIYLNIPDGRYQAAVHKYIPKKLQIIDEIYSIPQILHKFSQFGFEVVYIDIYGINTMCQYNAFVFKHKNTLQKKYAILAEPPEQKDNKKRTE